MKADITLLVPDNTEVNILLVMTIGEAKSLRAQLTRDQHPSWVFAKMLSKAIEAAEQHIGQTHEVER